METDSTEDSMAAAWLEWCDSLRGVPEMIERLGRPGDPRIQAEGYRYVSRLVRMALERSFEGTDSNYPRLLFAQGPTRKIGGDCPDAVYRDCTLDGNGQYRVFGYRGNAASIVFTVNRDPARAAYERKSILIDTITSDELSFSADGEFELWLGGTQRDGDWRPLDPDSTSLMIRQFFGAKESSEPARLSIERVDLPGNSPPPLLPGDVERSITGARLFVEHISRVWGAELHSLLARPNRLAPLDPEHQARLQATPGGVPLWGSYRLADDEALLIEFTPPDSEYWSLLGGGPWFESLDYRTRLCHLNMDQVDVDEDAIVRIVVSHVDSGVPNWIETGGNEEGFLLLRYLGDSSPPEASCEVIPVSKIREMLPATTRFVDSTERDADRVKRRGSSDRRFEGL